MKSFVSCGKVLLVLFLLGVGDMTRASTIAPVDSLDSLAKRRIARQNGLPVERLKTIYTKTSTHYLSNQTVYAFKVLDNKALTIYTIALNSKGDEVTPNHLWTEEQVAHRAMYGKLEPALLEWVRRASPSERNSVMIWVREPLNSPRITPPKPHSGVSQEQIDRYFAQVQKLREAQVASVVCPIVDRCRKLGISVLHARYVPVLFGDLTSNEVRLIQSWEEIDAIDIVREGAPSFSAANLNVLKPSRLLTDTRQTVRADVVEARGITGSGVKVALIETAARLAANFGDPNRDNPYLSGVVQDFTYICELTEGCRANFHATAVAGVIRSTHPTVRGIAPGVILRAGGSSLYILNRFVEQTETAIDWGAKVINMSWGESVNGQSCRPRLRLSDKTFDTLARNSRVTFTWAAGNTGGYGCGATALNPVIQSPARGYNVITVGAFDDQDTGHWSDDVMSKFSSWCIPDSLHQDRIKPEMLAPGTFIQSTLTSFPWVELCPYDRCGVSGTSFSTPVVTGIAALMLHRSQTLGSGLAAWPEAVKAILMVTATHNLVGEPHLSSCDGAGGVNAEYADDVVRGVNGGWDAKEYDCSNPSTDDVATINLVTGQRARVAIVWATDPNSPNYRPPNEPQNSRPSADLDLLIVNSAGNAIVAHSVSYDNTYEIVEFQASGSGTYKIRVVRNDCESGYPPGYLAWAWWTEMPQ